MNRAKKRHQKKLARKAFKKKHGHPPQSPGQAAGGVPPDNLLELVQKGLQLHQAGQLQEAETVYQQILDIKPDYAEAHSDLGTALFGMGRLDEAIASYHKALAIKPDYAKAHRNLGLAFKELGKLELYDLESDWAEKKDVTANRPEIVQKLSRKLDAWKQTLLRKPSGNSVSSTRVSKK